MSEVKEFCPFDENGFCKAMVCYSDFKCGARDTKGNPKYSNEGTMKPPILTEERVTGIVAKYIINDKPYPISELGERFGRALAEVVGTQRDKDYEHEQQTVREIFEEVEKQAVIAPFHKGQPDTMYWWISTEEWQSLKSRFLEGKPKEDNQ